MKLLVVLFTHDKYIHLIPKIWDRINELEFPEKFEVDKLIITESIDTQIINYAEKNNIPIQHTNINLNGLKNYNTDPRYISAIGWTFEQYYKVCKLRNFYLNIAKEENYDWLLQIDGDVLPPKDGAIKLLKENKKYIGAGVQCKELDGKYVFPDKIDEGKIYECNILGNCFHLEHSDCFNIIYSMPDNIPQSADSYLRIKKIKKYLINIYCHPLIKCKHLK